MRINENIHFIIVIKKPPLENLNSSVKRPTIDECILYKVQYARYPTAAIERVQFFKLLLVLTKKKKIIIN